MVIENVRFHFENFNCLLVLYSYLYIQTKNVNNAGNSFMFEIVLPCVIKITTKHLSLGKEFTLQKVKTKEQYSI